MDPLLLELLTRLSEAETGDWISETEESGDKGIDMAISTKKKKKKIIKTKKKQERVFIRFGQGRRSLIYLFCFRLKLEGGEVTRLLSGCLLDLYREEEGMDFFFLRKKSRRRGEGEMPQVCNCCQCREQGSSGYCRWVNFLLIGGRRGGRVK